MALFMRPLNTFIFASRRLQQISRRDIHRYVAPTLKVLKAREKRSGGKIVNPRNTFLEWNLESELFAFGKRLNEEFNEDLLLQAFTNRSYVLKEQATQKEIDIEITLNDNRVLADKGEDFMREYIHLYLEAVLPKLPLEGIKSIRDYLISDEVLYDISSNLGTKDIMLCAEFPPENATYVTTFKALIGALIESSGAEKAAHFVRDFVITYLNGKDINDLWIVSNPEETLTVLLKHSNLPDPEPRLIGEVGRNTVLACYRVGLYLDKKLFASGFGESIPIAKEMAAREGLKKLFGTQDNMPPINFKLEGIPKLSNEVRYLVSN